MVKLTLGGGNACFALLGQALLGLRWDYDPWPALRQSIQVFSITPTPCSGQGSGGVNAMQLKLSRSLAACSAVLPLLALPTVTQAQIVANPSTAPDCMNNTAFFNPTLLPSIKGDRLSKATRTGRALRSPRQG